MVSAAIKLSSPATREFWEIPVLFEDEHLLALDKPAGLLMSPDANAPERPSLSELLHAGIAQRKPWSEQRRLAFLLPAHRLDAEVGGALLLAKSKAAFTALADLFGAEKPCRKFVALVRGAPREDQFEINAKLAPHPSVPGLMRVDPKGKRAKSRFVVLERFAAYTMLTCEEWTSRPHQLRAHLHNAGLPVAGDRAYGGRLLMLSELKSNYRLKPNRIERPLISQPAMHAVQIDVAHPTTAEPLSITSPWRKDLTVAVKYLRKYAAGQG